MPVRRVVRYAAQFGQNLTAGLDAIARSSVGGRWQDALAATESIHNGTTQLREQAIVDAIATGADWWQIGQALGMHPQAAFDEYATLGENTRSPAQQRPRLAVLVTAGVVGVHRPRPEYGVDLGFAVSDEPRITQVQDAARLCGQRAWIRVTLPGRHAGEPTAGREVLARWTSVLRDEAGLARLSQALRLPVNAGA